MDLTLVFKRSWNITYLSYVRNAWRVMLGHRRTFNAKIDSEIRIADEFVDCDLNGRYALSDS